MKTTKIMKPTNSLSQRIIVPVIGLFVLLLMTYLAGGDRLSAASASDQGTLASKVGQGHGLGRPTTPLESLLNKDGTLNLDSGFSGSLDATAWQMVIGGVQQPRFVRADDEQAQLEQHSAGDSLPPRDENGSSVRRGAKHFSVPSPVPTSPPIPTPTFTPCSPSCAPTNTVTNTPTRTPTSVSTITPAPTLVRGNENWDARFGSLGINGRVWAIAISGANMYIGGVFTTVGGINANHIARWDGTRWYPLGSGVSGTDLPNVSTIAINGNDVYVGGSFTTAGGISANHIARWDGNQWHPLGSDMGNGINPGPVTTIRISGSDVYAGGVITASGGVSTNNVARWDGTQWHPLGSGTSNGVNSSVWTIAINGSNVYVGGYFTATGEVNANHIARWDGNQWYPLGEGVSGANLPFVGAIGISGSNVYVGGTFRTAGGVNANNIARWDGSQWYPLGNNMGTGDYDWIEAIGIRGNDVYVGGYFTIMGGVSAKNIARWDGSQWHPLGSGLGGSFSGVDVLTIDGLDIFAGGTFTVAGDKPSSNLALWHTLPQPTPTPTPTPCSINFTDVPPAYPFYQAIRYLYCHNVITGYGDTFQPGNTTTRGQLSKIVVLARGWTPQCPLTANFSDVPTSSVFYCFVETAYSRGIISGYKCGGPGEPCDGSNRPYFRPGDDVSRGQLSKIVVGAMGWTIGCPLTSHFTDVGSDNIFYCFIETAYSHAIISGYEDHTFQPNNSATRGQISKIVYQAVTQP